MILTIDPGMESMGWAAWSKKKWDENVAPPDCSGLIKGNSLDQDLFWWEKVAKRCLRVKSLVQESTVVYCEMPIFFSGSAVGLAAAQTASLQKLSYMVGSLAQAVIHSGGEFHPITVREWKGQLPKEVVEIRVIKAIGQNTALKLKLEKDMWDAVGIGLSIRGLL